MANDADARTAPDPVPSVELTHLPDLEGSPHDEVFDGGDPRTVRLHLEAGESVPPHRHPEATVVLYLVSGRLELEVGPNAHILQAGDAIRFDGRQEVSPEAIEETVALVVLAPRAEKSL